MRKFKWISLIMVVVLVLVVGCNQQEEQTPEPGNQGVNLVEDEEIISLAETFIDQLSNGEYEEATENFDETMMELVKPEDLEGIWLSLEEEFGNYIQQEYKTIEVVDEYNVVLITGIFNDENITFQVSLDKENKIAGFYIR